MRSVMFAIVTDAEVPTSKEIPSPFGFIILTSFYFSSGMAFRVPTIDISVVDLVVRLEKGASYDKKTQGSCEEQRDTRGVGAECNH